MMNAGVGLLTEDRKVLGLLPELSIRENVTIASLRRGSRRGLLPGREQADEADRLLDSLRLRAGSYDQPVSTLSGGNQQKVLLARWLLTKPKVLMFDEPTKGIDVGAKGELYDGHRRPGRAGAGHHRGLVVPAGAAGPRRPGARAARRGDRRRAARTGASEEDVLRLASGGGTGRRRLVARCQAACRRDDRWRRSPSETARLIGAHRSTDHEGGRQPAGRRTRSRPRLPARPRDRVITLGDIAGRESGGLVVLLVAVGALTLASDEFLTGNNLSNLARQVAIFGIIAVGQLWSS